MAEWHLALSLVALRTEIDRRWPNRDKTSDGSIGDASHAARKSDHNPDWDAGGVVRAIDVDKDGINVQDLLDAVVRDPRVAYVIWNRRIASATDDGVPWDWEPYDGTNPHDKHVHISIKHTTAAETNVSRWFDQKEEVDPLAGYTIQQLQQAAGVGVHGQRIGKSKTTIGLALEEILKDVRDLRAEVSELRKEVKK